MTNYDIATIDGDGIGPEVCQSAVTVLREACGDRLRFTSWDGGAAHYARTGAVLPDDTFAACRDSHAILHGAAGHSLNVRGAYLHVIGDLVGSAGAILAAILIVTTGMVIADPIISIIVGLLILYSSWKLVRESVDVLLESVPAHIDLSAVRKTIDDIPGVDQVHGCALGIGERVGNTSMDHLLLNLYLLGQLDLEQHDLSVCVETCRGARVLQHHQGQQS